MAAAVNGRMAAPSSGAPPPVAPIPVPQKFPSHADAPPGSLDPRVVALCNILANSSAPEVESALTRASIPPTPDLVESVLRLSYAHPSTAVRFFRWAALSSPHSPVAWNLMVDLLGKNSLFEAMWDAIRSMRDEPSRPLAPTTFISAFSSYCSAGRVKEAIMTFDVMDRYGIKPDTFVLNSLLSAICRAGGHTAAAVEFLDRVKGKVSPDADTFAILLEGWEKEGDVASAKRTFGEMVVRLGWDPGNTAAHDAFLATLVHGKETEEAIKFLQVMKSKGCVPGMRFFADALDVLVRDKDLARATVLWDTMLGCGITPNTIMYNAMIALHCDNRDASSAMKMLDEMPLQGAFADQLTYNIIFACLLKNKRVREAERFLVEMRKNEWPVSAANCIDAIKIFFEEYDPEAALEVWRCVLEDNVATKDECGNAVLLGLCELGRMPAARDYAEDMLARGIGLYSSTLEKLRSGFKKAGILGAYDLIERMAKIQ